MTDEVATADLSEPRSFYIIGDILGNGLSTERFSPLADERGGLIRLVRKLRPRLVQITNHPLDGSLSDGHYAVSVAFAVNQRLQ